MATEMKYDAEYFIKKFSRIPSSLWCVRSFHSGNRMCAVGHCCDEDGAFGKEVVDLMHLFGHDYPLHPITGSVVTRINDGYEPRYKQKTPKARMLAALRDIAGGSGKP